MFQVTGSLKSCVRVRACVIVRIHCVSLASNSHKIGNKIHSAINRKITSFLSRIVGNRFFSLLFFLLFVGTIVGLQSFDWIHSRRSPFFFKLISFWFSFFANSLFPILCDYFESIFLFFFKYLIKFNL